MKRILLAVAVCLSFGCQKNTSPAFNLAVSLVASAQSFPSRTPVTLTLTIHNPGDETAQVEFTSCERPFEVLDLAGQVVGPAPFQACALATLVSLVIEPGSSTNYAVAWSGDMPSSRTNELAFLPPNNYRIRARIPVGRDKFIYSDPIDITVTAAQ